MELDRRRKFLFKFREFGFIVFFCFFLDVCVFFVFRRVLNF